LDRENARARKEKAAELSDKLTPATKRKRGDVEQDDAKLKEFLEVMQPANKAKKWTADVGEDVSMEPPTKVQAVELPEGESDGEYEAVPKKSRQKSPLMPVIAVEAPVAEQPSVSETAGEEQASTPNQVDATDDDWLRSRTSRLLDLVDPDDIPVPSKADEQSDSAPFESFEEEPLPITQHEEAAADELEPEAEEAEQEDPTLAAIRSNGRLFVRNLPYTATEDDLRAHFAPFGALEEVSLY